MQTAITTGSGADGLIYHYRTQNDSLIELIGDDYEIVIRRRKDVAPASVRLPNTSYPSIPVQHWTGDPPSSLMPFSVCANDPCEGCSGNPKFNPNASGVCHCARPALARGW